MDQNTSERPEAFQIFTLNCWGLKYIAKWRKERLDEIGKRIANASPAHNIVGLQECWTTEDYKAIRRYTKGVLPYGKYYHSGIFGGGLAILSKWPIVESNMHRYPLNGRPTAFFRGDWYVGKGIACAKIKYGPGVKDIVEVFCTHLHAPYEREPHDSYLCHRTAQAWDIAKFMRDAVVRGHMVVGLGDFNMIPESLAHRIVVQHGMVFDTWRSLHPDSSLGAAIDEPEMRRGHEVPSASFNLSTNGTTCDSILNTWRWSSEDKKRMFKGETVHIDPESQDPRGKRLDYVFFGGIQTAERPWRISQTSIGMIEPHPTLGCTLSDHFSVEVVVNLSSAQSDARHLENGNTHHPEDSGGEALLPPAKQLTEGSLSQISSSMSPYLPPSTYEEILSMISTYTLRERLQRRWRLGHFLAAVPISVGCLVAVFWSPHEYVSFILMLLSTLGLGTGVIDGLIGGLFVGSELRALKEFEWEISNSLALSTGRVLEESDLRDWYD
ncbi:phospholipase C type enzyme [Agyrium rufum]|nr:phospholipase C type enzyme [Agyrium rufum]